MNSKLFKNKLKALSALFTVLLITGAAFAFTTAKTSPHHKTVKKSGTTYKWFSITDGIAPGSQVPKADASYLGEGTTPPAGSPSCGGSTNQCVSGFLPSKVNPMTNQLINDHQTPDDDSRLQN